MEKSCSIVFSKPEPKHLVAISMLPKTKYYASGWIILDYKTSVKWHLPGFCLLHVCCFVLFLMFMKFVILTIWLDTSRWHALRIWILTSIIWQFLDLGCYSNESPMDAAIAIIANNGACDLSVCWVFFAAPTPNDASSIWGMSLISGLFQLVEGYDDDKW